MNRSNRSVTGSRASKTSRPLDYI